MSKVYLCGGINGLSDSDCRDWREYAKSTLRMETLDPMRRDYRGKEDENIEAIIEGDLRDIDECDVILANCSKPSWGTAMEIFYAHKAGKIVYVVVPEGVRVSPWLYGHCTERFETFDEAIRTCNEL